MQIGKQYKFLNNLTAFYKKKKNKIKIMQVAMKCVAVKVYALQNSH